MERLDAINKILKRMVFGIIRTIVQVASQTNLWIVVHGRPTGICVLLEEALATLNNTIVLVVDSPMKKSYVNFDSKVKFAKKQLNLPDVKDKSKEEKDKIVKNIEEEVRNTVAMIDK